jgi:ParB family transcriptional regulator, chromosome partitioning protein
MLAVADIVPNPHQPRTHFDPAALAELAASIAEHGVIQPLIVTETPQQPDRYWLIAGERRWRAAQEAGLEEVPAIVREATNQQLLEWALVENVQRADLNPLEEAAAYQSLLNDFNLTQAQVAARVGKSRSAVANAVRLLSLPSSVQSALNQQHISAGHARSLLGLPDAQTIQGALDLILDRELNVRQTEALVRKLLDPPVAPVEPTPARQSDSSHLRSLEDRFRTRLGTKVSLDRREDGSGRLVVHFYSDDDLENIYRQIVGDDGREEW